MMQTLSAIVYVALAAAAMVTEPKTGVQFDAAYNAGGEQLTYTGASYRSKWGFQVYALAHYADPAAKADGDAAAQLAHWAKADAAKAIVLKFVRDVEYDKITEALNEAFDEAGYKGDTRENFAAAFKENFKKGDSLAFEAAPGGKLRAVQNGKEIGSWSDPALVSALWGTWLGENSVLADRTKLVAGKG